MGRAVVVVIGVVCAATVVSEAAGLGLLWYRGQLTAETLNELAQVLRGEAATAKEETDRADIEEPSLQQVVETRAMRTLDLLARENELNILKALVVEKRDALLGEKMAFEKEKRAFEEELERTKADMNSEATEQGRTVLLALQPDDAARTLMGLDLSRNVVLLSGMPPRTIGRILSVLQAGDEDQRDRAAKIFEALSTGEPSRTAMESAGRTTPEPGGS